MEYFLHALSVMCMCVCVCAYLFPFFLNSDHICQHVICWGIPLYREQCVFKYIRCWFSLKLLSHWLDCFKNGSIVNFALVQGFCRGEFLCVIEFLCRCWLVSRLVPHHCWLNHGERDNGRVFKPLNVSAQPWDWIKRGRAMSTGLIRRGLLLHLHTCLVSWIKLSYTGLLGYTCL